MPLQAGRRRLKSFSAFSGAVELGDKIAEGMKGHGMKLAERAVRANPCWMRKFLA